jgi:hypothetical protein
VKYFVCEDYTDGRGENARKVRKARLVLHDKLGALEKLGKHLGLFEGKPERKTRDAGLPDFARLPAAPDPLGNQH